MPLAVHEQSNEIKALHTEWCMLEALRGGTPKMRAAAKKYLPQWPNEEDDAYQARLNTATLFPAFSRTVSVMSGKPFAKPLQLKDTDKRIEAWAEDIDLQGVSLNSFAAEMFEETVGFGLAGLLVEYPKAGPARGRTVAAVEAAGLRPYMVRIMHSQILGGRIQNVGGRMKLVQLRLLETYEEDDGPWGTSCQPQVRVLTPGAWEIWRAGSGSDKSWQKVETGVTSLTDIPFVPLHGRRESILCGRPPLLDLAYLNVKHWQSQSDQDTILHVARVPILAMIGADEQSQLTVGGSAAVKLPLSADMKFVEHSGAAIEAGANSLTALEEQMIQTGAELLVQKPGQRTATEDANDAEGNKCDLQRIAENFEDAIDQALVYMGQFARIDNPGSVSLFSDYGAATLSDASATLIKDLALAGMLTKVEALKELQRRGVLSPDIDPEVEAAAAAAEGPALGAIGNNDPLQPVA